jgi:hypothetical protein
VGYVNNACLVVLPARINQHARYVETLKYHLPNYVPVNQGNILIFRTTSVRMVRASPNVPFLVWQSIKIQMKLPHVLDASITVRSVWRVDIINLIANNVRWVTPFILQIASNHVLIV